MALAASASALRLPAPATSQGATANQVPSGNVAGVPGTLRICADPNNLPFSNERGEGFENKLAELVARDLDRRLEYTWWPQRRGFIRNTLRSGRCDVVMGIPATYEMAEPTSPYYRSSYMFVTRRDRDLHPTTLDDPILRTARIGVHVIGDDYANVPPAQALAARGIIANVVGYSIYGDYSRPDPPRELIDGVARGDVDIAIAWGPLAGYFATKEPVALDLAPVDAGAALKPPMSFAIAMGVRPGDEQLRAALELVLEHRRGEIRDLLSSFGVPLLDLPRPADSLAARMQEPRI
jgi:quinoprotein dehydrogenase-associated probable ABC transporter substrate-binding protein